MHSVFVYFKASNAHREQVLVAINDLGAGIARDAGASFTCSLRADAAHHDSSTSPVDTWLEHYQCPDDQAALAILTRLGQIASNHPLLALTEAGLNGRHLEHFVDTTVCA
ncbi:MAG: DUF4936 family protein [Burkholderiaceae bacterium]